MKKIVLSIIVTLLFSGVTYSQIFNNGRSVDAKPSVPIPEVKIVQPVKDTITETGSDRDVPELLKSAESTADVLHNDDVIINGSLAVGVDAVNGEVFGSNTIVLKENNLRILFDDTSNSESFPNNDWMLKANDSENGGANYFAISDATAGRDIFKIEAHAPANSIYVEDYGRVGFGTSSPAVELHVADGDTPTLRLDQDGSSGWTAQIWDVAGNETNFFIRDATNGSKLPFRIQPNTPSSTLTLKSDGKVGIGTWSPEAKLHVTGNAKIEGEICLKPISLKEDDFLTPNEGMLAMDSISHSLKYYNGTEWVSSAGIQDISLVNDTLAITGSSAKVSLAAYMDNTDNQILQLSGTVLSIAGGNSVDLDRFTTDRQRLSFEDNILNISGATTPIDFSQYLDNTDDQELSLSGSVLSISGSESSVDLSGIVEGTDDQTLSLDGSILSIVDGNSVDLSGVVEDTDDQTLSLDGTTLSIVDGNSVDLSGISENTDEQTLSFNGTSLSISNGNSVDLSELVSDQQNQITDLNEQVETLTSQLAELKELVATLMGTSEVSVSLKSSSIDQNIPNPFSTTTVIPYNIARNVKSAYIGFYTQTGQLIKTVQINERGSGSYTFVPGNSSQIYLYTLFVDGVKVETKKMMYTE